MTELLGGKPLDPGQELLVTNSTVVLFPFRDSETRAYMWEKLVP